MLLLRLRLHALLALLVTTVAACGGGEEANRDEDAGAQEGVTQAAPPLQPLRCGDPGYLTNAWGNRYHGRQPAIRLTYGRAQIRIKNDVLPDDGIFAIWFFPSMKERSIVYAGSERTGGAYTPPAGEQPFTLRINYGTCRNSAGQNVEATGIVRLEDGKPYTQVVASGPGFIEVQIDSFASTYAAAAPDARVREVVWDTVMRDTMGIVVPSRQEAPPGKTAP